MYFSTDYGKESIAPPKPFSGLLFHSGDAFAMGTMQTTKFKDVMYFIH